MLQFLDPGFRLLMPVCELLEVFFVTVVFFLLLEFLFV